MNTMHNPLPSAVVRVTLSVLTGSTEDLTATDPRMGQPLKDGQRHWYIQSSQKGEGFVSLHPSGAGRGPAGTSGFSVTVGLQPGGKYALRVGLSTRFDFTAPLHDATLVVTPTTGQLSWESTTGEQLPRLALVPDRAPTPQAAPVRTSAPVQTSTPTKASDPHHILGLADAVGVTYPTGPDAFAAVGVFVGKGVLNPVDIGRSVFVRAGEYPMAAAPALVVVQPAPVVVQPAPVDTFTVRTLGQPSIPPNLAHTNVVAVQPAPVQSQPAPLASVQIGRGTAPTVAPLATVDTRAGTKLQHDWTGAEETVSDVALSRLAEDARHLESVCGLTLSPVARVLGGRVNGVGRENLSRSYEEWTKLPRVIDAMATMQAAVRAEQRIDVPAPRACDVAMLPDGSLRHSDWTMPLWAEQDALTDVVREHSSVLPNAGRLMTQLSPSVRAAVWNDRVPHSTNQSTRMFRTRLSPSGKRSIYAMVSPGYTSLDSDQLAGIVADALTSVPGGTEARGTAIYQPDSLRTSIDGSWHVDRVTDFACGDTFKLGFRVWSHDGGSGAINVGFSAFRNLCYNLIIVAEDKTNLVRIVHRGDRAKMVREVREAIVKVGMFAQPFLARWGYAQQAPLSSLLINPSQENTVNVRAILRGIAGVDVDAMPDLPQLRSGALPEGVSIDGIERDTLVERLLAGFAHEPGDRLDSILNAVTRLHSERVPVPVLAQAEKVAGAMLLHWTNTPTA